MWLFNQPLKRLPRVEILGADYHTVGLPQLGRIKFE